MLKAFTELPKDNSMKELFEFSLAVGNYLNGTTPRGGAWGFKLDNIDKVLTNKPSSFSSKMLKQLITRETY
jgi:hypothetical protein